MADRIAFILEHTLGHITHGQNLRSAITDPGIDPSFIDIPYAGEEWWSKLPVVRNNWTLKLSLRARTLLREREKSRPFDAVFFHTQVPAHLSFGRMKRSPCVVSMDATPANRVMIEGRTPSRGSIRHRWTRAVLRRAAGVVAWSEFVARSAREDYDVPAQHVHVIPPGIDVDSWRPAGGRVEGNPVRILFVGGDFRRKGGDTLLAALANGLGGSCSLDLVTADRSIVASPSVRVHHGIAPNSPELRRLYEQADLFVLPTRKDFSPLAILEAMASALPVIATRVGAIAEQVVDGTTGILIAANDPAALAHSVRSLIQDAARRRQFGAAGRARVIERFSARTNAAAIAALLRQLIATHRGEARP